MSPNILDEIQSHLDTTFNLPPPKDHEYNVSAYFSGHDKALVVSKGNKVIEVVEGERLLGLKNGDWEYNKVSKNYPTNSYERGTKDLYSFYNRYLISYVKEKYPGISFNNYFGTDKDNVYIKCNNYVHAHHHSSHALGAFYQSPFKKALVITYDGGSPDRTTVGVFVVERGSRPLVVGALEENIVSRYPDLGHLFECIEWQPAKGGHTLPGKIMALASYGKPNSELLSEYKSICTGLFPPDDLKLWNKYKNEFNAKDFYTTNKMKEMIEQGIIAADGKLYDKQTVNTLYSLICQRVFLINNLLEKEKIPNSKELAPLGLAYQGINYFKHFNNYNDEQYFKSIKRIPDEKAFDMAASLQLACEELFFERVSPFLEKYPDLPIVLAGGGALNIILNSRIKKETGRQVFVGPDPSDCGLALGAMLGYLRPKKAYSNPYTGIPILDKDSLGVTIMNHVGVNSNLSKYIFVEDVRNDISYVAKAISEGKIIGIVRNRSERGPRALGNRSIICSASLPHIKDTLNAKVKFREWFRPFAPIVRLEDVSKFFDWEGESRYMNFCINVKEEYRDKLPAITHVDGTARVQTITNDQNAYMHRILTELDKITGIGVMVNTSFNVNGRPLVNSVKEAFYMLENTELDGIIIQDTLILKK